MNMWGYPFVHKGRCIVCLFAWKTPAVGWKIPSTLLERKVILGGITGKKRGCRCCKLLKIACKLRVLGIEKKGPTDRRGQIVSPEMDGLSSPKLWPRNRQQLHVCGRVCQLEYSSPRLLFPGKLELRRGGVIFPAFEKASVGRSVRNLSPFTPCRGEWERWENAFWRNRSYSCHPTAVMTCQPLG